MLIPIPVAIALLPVQQQGADDGSQPHWLLGAFVGSLIGLLLPYAIRLAVYVSRRFHRAELEGQWHQANFTIIDGQPSLGRELWVIKKGIRYPLVLVAFSMPGKRRKYRGVVSFQRNHMIVQYSGTDHTENCVSRSLFPATPRDQVIPGVWMSFDHDGRITAGVQVLSEVELSEDECREKMIESSWLSRELRMLQIRGFPTRRDPSRAAANSNSTQPSP